MMDLDIENDSKNQVKLLPELWGMIFRKLDSHELSQNLGLVCKEWHDIIQNDPLFSSELKIKKENKLQFTKDTHIQEIESVVVLCLGGVLIHSMQLAVLEKLILKL